MPMSDVAFLMIAISLLMVAFLTAVATLNASPKVSRITNRVIYGSCVAALVSVALAVWFLFRPPA
jgi:L-cystine uptake protein TcyP (sodium:dicarboxylate symporter family)